MQSQHLVRRRTSESSACGRWRVRRGLMPLCLAIGLGTLMAGCKRREAVAPTPAPPANAPAAPVAPAPSPPAAEMLAFVAKTDSGFAACVVNADGGGLTTIGNVAQDYRYVLWSPNGEMLSMVTEDQDGRWLILATPDGKTRVKLGDGKIARTPYEQWGRGGKAIAAVCKSASGLTLYAFSADGSSSLPIEAGIENEDMLDFWDYSWCSDEPRLAFDHFQDVQDAWCRISIADLEQGAILSVAPGLPGVCVEPSWSPDGTRLVFCHKHGEGPARLYVVDADGRDPRPISGDCEGPGREYWWPMWSPDSKKVAFDCERCEKFGEFHCHVVDVKGRLLAHIGPSVGCFDPRWSPDGNRLLVSLGAGTGGVGVYEMDSGSFGTAGEALVGGILLARWAPDSRRILLVGAAERPGVVAVASTTDGSFRVVSGHVSDVATAAWSPSGRRILLVETSAESPDLGTLYTANADGSNLTKVYDGLISATSPTWRPEPGRGLAH
ncbi:MAG: hypothetical protein ACE5O2_05980 [Armatimonadota bacterium]